MSLQTRCGEASDEAVKELNVEHSGTTDSGLRCSSVFFEETGWPPNDADRHGFQRWNGTRIRAAIMAERFETMMESGVVKGLGVVLGCAMLAVSGGFLYAAKSPSKPLVVKKVMPDVESKMPLMRASPYTELRVLEMRALMPAPLGKMASNDSKSSKKTLISQR